MMRRVALAMALAAMMGTASAVELPPAIKSAGVLHLSVSPTYAPMEYHDAATNELKGVDIDLANAIARRLGLTIAWSDVPFAQLVPSLQTGRTDFIISGFSDRASRRDVMMFVDYLKTGPQFVTLAGSAITAPAGLCGARVGTVRSTSFPIEIGKWSKANCEDEGRPAISYVPGENGVEVLNELRQGRIDAAVQGSETLPWVLANAPGVYRIVGKSFAQGEQGIAFLASAHQLRDAVTDALRGMMADGSYRAILAKWGLQDNALAEPTLNASPQ